MHVLMLSWEYPPHSIGGMGTHVADLIPALHQDGVAITLLTPLLGGGAPVEDPAPGIHLVRVPTTQPRSGSFPSYVLRVNQELAQAALALEAQGGFDLVHTHDWMTAAAATHLAARWQLPLVATIHATERGRGRGYLRGDHAMQIDQIEHELSQHAQRIIVCSNYMAAEVTASFGPPTEHIDVVPNAVTPHPSPFQSNDERLAFRRQYAADDAYMAFFIGRVVQEKGVHVLIDAWAQVAQHTGAKLVLAGSGPSLNDCKGHVAHLGLEQYVSFPGRISDLERERFYRAADVAVFPSLYEPFGIVALEAQAADCPVVVTQTGGFQEIIRPHETGIIVTPGDVGSLVWGLLHTLQNPRWSRMRASNAMRDLKQIYSWAHVAHETRAIYRQLLDAGDSPVLPVEPAAPSGQPVGTWQSVAA